MLRVRTGCLVCRARKIKCDEHIPCRNCSKRKARCIYGSPRSNTGALAKNDHTSRREELLLQETSSSDVSNASGATGNNASFDLGHSVSQNGTRSIHRSQAPESVGSAVQQNDSLDSELSAPNDGHATTPTDTRETVPQVSDRLYATSQIIYLTLAMDCSPASEAPSRQSYSYFLAAVACPFITPFDPVNWLRFKEIVVYSAEQHPLIASAILALQSLHRAQAFRLPMTHGMSKYEHALTEYKALVHDDDSSFDLVLEAAFLLCLCIMTMPNEDTSTFTGADEQFVARLEAWSVNDHRSILSIQLAAWLQLLDTAAKRSGSPSLLPESIVQLLHQIRKAPGLSQSDHETHPDRVLCDMLSGSSFTFYLALQKISSQVADITHYRRSRVTSEDQAEADAIAEGLRDQMRILWDDRPKLLQLRPSEYRSRFYQPLAASLGSLVGVYLATYFAEIVALGRTLGDPPFPTAKARDAMKSIRDIIDDECSVSERQTISAGYLRPLFLYGIESFDEASTQWAADRLRQIADPISRSAFFATFLETHGEAQRDQRRRVTVKYFTMTTFGVPLPFL